MSAQSQVEEDAVLPDDDDATGEGVGEDLGLSNEDMVMKPATTVQRRM
jgi:hypothetical protein